MAHLWTPYNRWVVVAAASYSVGWTLTYVGSVFLFVEHLMALYDIDYETTALLTTAVICCSYLSVIANVFFAQFGYRKSIMGAAVTCAFSQVMSAYSSEYWLVVLLLGFVNGIGGGILCTGPVMVVGYLFSDHDRHRALAVVNGGVGIGIMLMPTMVGALIELYSFRGCLVVLAGFTLQIAAAGALLPDKVTYFDKSHPTKPSKEPILPQESYPSVNRNLPLTLVNAGKFTTTATPYKRYANAPGYRLLRDPRLHLLNAASFLFAFTFAVMASFANSILVLDYELTQTERAAILTAGGAASILGRMSVGLCPKGKRIPRWSIFCLDGFMEGMALVLLAFLPIYGAYSAAFAQVLYGFAVGFIITMHQVVVADAFKDDFGTVYAWNTFVMMLATLVAPVFAGWLGDMTNSFSMPLCITGFSQMTGFSLPIIWLFASRLLDRSPCLRR